MEMHVHSCRSLSEWEALATGCNARVARVLPPRLKTLLGLAMPYIIIFSSLNSVWGGDPKP